MTQQESSDIINHESRSLTLVPILKSRSNPKGSPNFKKQNKKNNASYLQLVPRQSLLNPETHQSSRSCPSFPSRHPYQHSFFRRSAHHLLKYEHSFKSRIDPSDDWEMSKLHYVPRPYTLGWDPGGSFMFRAPPISPLTTPLLLGRESVGLGAKSCCCNLGS